MKTEICTFNGYRVSFVVNKENLMVNATEMAKIFDRKIEAFSRNESTQSFINACLKSENSRFLNISKEDDLLVSKQKTGTWMHRVLALKFAAWLNPAFELWVYTTIENLLFGRHIKREQSYELTLGMQREMDELRVKPNKTGVDFERYLTIQKDLRYEKALRKALTSEGIAGMKNLFE